MSQYFRLFDRYDSFGKSKELQASVICSVTLFFLAGAGSIHTYIVLVGKGNKCEFIRPSITNGNSVSGWRGVALLMAVQFLLPTLTCYEKSGNFPRKTSASLKLRTPPRSCLVRAHLRLHSRLSVLFLLVSEESSNEFVPKCP